MTAESQGRKAATRFRREHGLGFQPLSDLVTLIEQETGIDVAVLDTPAGEHGLTIRDPQREATFIAVARSKRPMRQRSSLAHELGHVIFGDWTDDPVTRRSHEEIRADVFARHLLLPSDALRQRLGAPGSSTIDLRILSNVVERYLVSPAMAAIALEGGGYVDSVTKQQWMSISTSQLATRFGWSDYYAGLQEDANRARAPRRLLDRALRGYVLGVVSVESLASLRRMPVDALLQELEAAGIRPDDQQSPWAAPDQLASQHVDLTDLPGLDDATEEHDA